RAPDRCVVAPLAQISASVGKHIFWSLFGMAGDFIGYRCSGSGLTTGQLQTKGPRWYSWLVPICISLPVVCGIVVVLMSQTASADDAPPRATSIVDNQSQEHKRGELDDGCPSVPCPELVVPQFVLPADVANKVGHKIWINETRGNRNAITSWNANEEFASLGI